MINNSCCLALLCGSLAITVFAQTDYPLTEDSKPQAGVQQGELQKFTFDQSNIFPGTTREVSVYLPRQYDATTPACVYVGQDGGGFNATTVFDNLIARKEIPVLIGVFIKPGVVKAADTNSLDRFNRSLEYDGLGPDYARFVLTEIFPAVEKLKTADGRTVRLSTNGNDRCIGGASSGAICAFTAVWERPDAFSRVFSSIGTYVGLRGGNDYPTLVRKFEPKPIRVFLQDGTNDLNIYAGDWWMVNQEMERAFTFAGYEHEHVWGSGGHDGKQATAIFPDAMRFLWKGWPETVKAGESKNPFLHDILIPGEDWQIVSSGHRFTEGPAANAQGEVFFSDIPTSKTFRVTPDGKVEEFLADSKKANGAAFGPDGKLHMIATASNQVVVCDTATKATVVLVTDIQGNDLVVRRDGSMFVTEPFSRDMKPGNVWFISASGEKRLVDSTGLKFPNGITLSPDQSLLYVADARSHWVYSYQVLSDGTLTNKQRYFHLHVPDTADDSGADGMRCDRDGRLYVATRMGIQVCDQAGRVNCILPTPNGRVSNLTFGGEKFDTLFCTCGDKVFKRRLKVSGAMSFAAPIKPTAPRL
ncbi:MAG: gluconolactonase [Verrucomicrobia bacterium]|nr:gluconolactonase [Verrucomicrobiota bacterium]